MKTDYSECIRISSTSGGEPALNRPIITHVTSIRREAPMSSTKIRREKVIMAGEINKKTDEEIDALIGNTLTILRKFLSSWAFQDIGPITARNIVAAFGIRTLQVIMRSPHELLNVEGVGKKRMQAMLAGWKFQRKLVKHSVELMRLTSYDQ